jgi:hypothetical protein
VSSDKEPHRIPFTVFSSAAEEAAMKGEQQEPDKEGGHMSSTAGRVRHVAGAELPYVVVLTHHLCEATEHPFASMREAEAFINRNTPVPGATLSALYDRPASESGLFNARGRESSMNDEEILARLKLIDQRLRQISTEDAAAVLAGALVRAGLHEQERLVLIAETEHILDELDGKNEE